LDTHLKQKSKTFPLLKRKSIVSIIDFFINNKNALLKALFGKTTNLQLIAYELVCILNK